VSSDRASRVVRVESEHLYDVTAYAINGRTHDHSFATRGELLTFVRSLGPEIVAVSVFDMERESVETWTRDARGLRYLGRFAGEVAWSWCESHRRFAILAITDDRCELITGCACARKNTDRANGGDPT
jgi:hypothetical protein